MLPDIKSIKGTCDSRPSLVCSSLFLYPLSIHTVKSVRDILYDAPKEDGPVPVMYLGEDIYGMVQEREVNFTFV